MILAWEFICVQEEHGELYKNLWDIMGGQLFGHQPSLPCLKAPQIFQHCKLRVPLTGGTRD
jgi:hypothetical protein